MSWPSGSKAGTTHVDNGNDLLRNARADIKQNIDNVNDIIDEFNISSPDDGDLLQYSSSSGKWEQVASSSVGGKGSSLVPFNTPPTSLSIGENDLTIQSDAVDHNGVTVSTTDDDFQFTDTGTYYVRFFGTGKSAAANVTFVLKNKTDSSELFLQDVDNSSGLEALEQVLKLKKLTVSNTAHKYKVTVKSTSSSTSMTEVTGAHIEFFKI